MPSIPKLLPAGSIVPPAPLIGKHVWAVLPRSREELKKGYPSGAVNYGYAVTKKRVLSTAVNVRISLV
jgi:hypothetical protein